MTPRSREVKCAVAVKYEYASKVRLLAFNNCPIIMRYRIVSCGGNTTVEIIYYCIGIPYWDLIRVPNNVMSRYAQKDLIRQYCNTRGCANLLLSVLYEIFNTANTKLLHPRGSGVEQFGTVLVLAFNTQIIINYLLRNRIHTARPYSVFALKLNTNTKYNNTNYL